MQKNHSNSPTEWIAGFRQGNQECFQKIYLSLIQQLYYFGTKFIQEQDVALDIVHESFIKVWERKECINEYNMLRSYLYTSVRNASINWIKKYRYKTDSFDHLYLEEHCVHNDAFPDIVDAEAMNSIINGIEQLPYQSRNVIKMLYMEGKKPRQVAETLGVSISTVKTLKARSILKLKMLEDPRRPV
jgi:RNA polymerase sigma factor (sigma-70 family)